MSNPSLSCDELAVVTGGVDAPSRRQQMLSAVGGYLTSGDLWGKIKSRARFDLVDQNYPAYEKRTANEPGGQQYLDKMRALPDH
jgi:hypothetical protein